MRRNLDILLEYMNNSRRDYFRKKATGGDDEEMDTVNSDISVSCKETFDPVSKKTVQILTLKNITPEDEKKIYDALNRNPQLHTLQVAMPKSRNIKEDILNIRIDDDEVGAWMNEGGLAKVVDILKASGNYSPETIENLPGNISNVMTSKIERKELYNKSYNSVIDTWLRYLKTINDPETLELLKTYARIFQDDKVYGHVLSLQNVQLIRSVNNTAAFVLPASTWRVKFNRYVKPGAKKYIVRSPFDPNDSVSAATIKKTIKRMGWGDTPYGKLPIQAQMAVDIETKRDEFEQDKFKTTVEYDISDTEVIKGKRDIFSETIGLLNNLTGELNLLARGDQEKKNLPVAGDDIMAKRTELAAEAVKGMCEESGIRAKYNNPNDSSAVLVDALYAYYLAMAEKTANLDKDTNKEQFARNATHFTLIFAKLAWNRLSFFTHPVEYTRKECAEFLNIVNRVLSRLEPATVLKENNGAAYSREQLISAFKKFCADNKITITN